MSHSVEKIAPTHIHSPVSNNQSNSHSSRDMASSSDDSFTFTVGKLDAGMAILIGERASLIEFPSLLLPPGVTSGSVVNIRVNRNQPEEKRQRDEFAQLQQQILDTFGRESPKPPALRLRNVTQTSVTLEWDRLSLATASLLSLDIYRNGERLAPIPNPLQNTSTKLSGLGVDSDYTFHLVLKTTSGTYSSPIIKTRTHTMTDTSGISVCFGNIEDSQMDKASKEVLLEKLKGKCSEKIQIDTTHYVCSDPRNRGDLRSSKDTHGVMYNKALQLSIPVVQPHWIFACSEQKKMVPISAYYLDQDPPNASRIRESISKASQPQSQSEPSSTSSASNANQTNPTAAEGEPQTPSGVANIDASSIRAGPAVIEPMPEEEGTRDGMDQKEIEIPPRPISRDQSHDTRFGSRSIQDGNTATTSRERERATSEAIRNGEHDEEVEGNAESKLGREDEDEDEGGEGEGEGEDIKLEQSSMDDVSLANENERENEKEKENEESPADEEIDLS